MKTDWKWNPELAEVTGIDNGNCRIVVAKIFGKDAKEIEEHGKLIADTQYLKNLLTDMCYQFGAYDHLDRSNKRILSTGGLSILEEAFDYLGWDDPHEYSI